VTADEFPPAVLQLLHQHLPTMDHVEVLLHLHAAADRRHEVRTIATATRIPEHMVHSAVIDLVHAGLALRGDGDVSFNEASGARPVIAQLADLYNTRPVTLVRAIYSRPSPLKSFVDAFRLRKEES
jgi:hypothetical protein